MQWPIREEETGRLGYGDSRQCGNLSSASVMTVNLDSGCVSAERWRKRSRTLPVRWCHDNGKKTRGDGLQSVHCCMIV